MNAEGKVLPKQTKSALVRVAPPVPPMFGFVGIIRCNTARHRANDKVPRVADTAAARIPSYSQVSFISARSPLLAERNPVPLCGLLRAAADPSSHARSNYHRDYATAEGGRSKCPCPKESPVGMLDVQDAQGQVRRDQTAVQQLRATGLGMRHWHPAKVGAGVHQPGPRIRQAREMVQGHDPRLSLHADIRSAIIPRRLSGPGGMVLGAVHSVAPLHQHLQPRLRCRRLSGRSRRRRSKRGSRL